MSWRRLLWNGRTVHWNGSRTGRVLRQYSTQGQPQTNRLASVIWATGMVAAAGYGAYWWSNSSGPQELDKIVDTLNKPVFDKFLPDKIDDPKHPRPYTLVIDLDHFLVSHQWDKELGRWRVAKRPGAEVFLFYAAQLYEVVVFSSMKQFDGDAIVKKMDPFGCVNYSLFRFATSHENGRYLKDLKVLNRDLAKTVVIGHDVDGFGGYKENMLAVKPWSGDPEDNSLEEAIDFLEGLALSRAKDVRPIVKQFQSNTKFFPASYDSLQSQVFEEAKLENQKRAQARSQNFLIKFFSGVVSSKPSSEVKSYYQRKQERMELRRKEWQHVKGLMQKQLDAEMAKEKQFYSEHKMPLWDLFSKGPPPPPPSSPGT